MNTITRNEGIDAVKALLRVFLRKIDADYERFLNERSREWSKHVRENSERKLNEDNVSGPELERRQLLNQIVEYMSLYNRRDIRLLKSQSTEQLHRIENLETCRRRAGLHDTHPTVLAAKSHLYMATWNFEQAMDCLHTAINLGEGALYKNKLPVVVNRMNLARCLYMQSQYKDALDESDSCLDYAISLEKSPNDVASMHSKFSVDPRNYCPPRVYGFLSVCDARVHNPDWSRGTGLDAEFNAAWDDSSRFYGTPSTWLPYMKLMIVSDHVWATKLPSYIEDIAASLYINLGRSHTARWLRFAQANFGGFSIDMSAVRQSTLASALIACLFLYGQPIQTDWKVQDLTQPNVIAQILEEGNIQYGNISVQSVGDTLKEAIENEGQEADEYMMTAQLVELGSSESSLYMGSGGEQTTEHI